MSSSTFHSRRGGFLVLCGSLLASGGLSVFYMVRIDPEISFWRAAVEKKREWSGRVHRGETKVNIFSGGSSVAFQVDAALLSSQYGIPSVNAGLHAGMGLDGTLGQASEFLKKGDRLVLMTEPPLLAEGGGEMTGLALQLRLATGAAYSFRQAKIAGSGYRDALVACRPGLRYFVTMLSGALRQPYRYRVGDIREDGRITTELRKNFSRRAATVEKLHLSPQAKEFLKELKNWAARREIEVVYMLPVAYVPSAVLEEQRAANREFLKEVGEIIPAWADEYLGASAELADFSDTQHHMSKEAALKRTQILAEVLAENLPSR